MVVPVFAENVSSGFCTYPRSRNRTRNRYRLVVYWVWVEYGWFGLARVS